MTFMFGEMPEELRQMIGLRHLEAQVTRNEVDRLMDELSIEDLVTFRTVMRYVASDPSAYNFFDGVIYSRLRREGRCTSCGGPDHDHEAFEGLTEDDEDELNPAEKAWKEAGKMAVEVLPTIDAVMAESGLSVDDYTNMTTYNLDDLRDADTGDLLGFVCLNCGMTYPSIADRMLRAPDECSGCFRKAGHG
jgi:hypothetical protein